MACPRVEYTDRGKSALALTASLSVFEDDEDDDAEDDDGC
jgi:hypothetical protein